MLGDSYENGKYADGAKIFEDLTLSDNFEEFLTLPAYEYITK